MSITAHQYRSELFRKLAAEAEEVGRVRGEAQAVLTVLAARGVQVNPDVQEQIMACTDLDQLETWLRRATTATTIDDVILE